MRERKRHTAKLETGTGGVLVRACTGPWTFADEREWAGAGVGGVDPLLPRPENSEL